LDVARGRADVRAFWPKQQKAAANGDLLLQNPSRRAPARRQFAGSDFLELIGGGLAGAAVLRDFVAHLLAFAQIAQARALDGADMNENVRAAIVRLNESEAFLTIEPLHDSGSHVISPSMFHKVGPPARGRVDRCLEEVVSGFVTKASPS